MILVFFTAKSIAFSLGSNDKTKSCVISESSSRRSFLDTLALTVSTTVTGFGIALPSNAAESKEALISDLEVSRIKMQPIPELLKKEEWDSVRSILKTSPVNKLWNLGESKNTVAILAQELGEVDLLELKDELALTIQMCDQLTYGNAFVYFQPGNGKINIKEPSDLANKSMSQIDNAIKIAKAN